MLDSCHTAFYWSFLCLFSSPGVHYKRCLVQTVINVIQRGLPSITWSSILGFEIQFYSTYSRKGPKYLAFPLKIATAQLNNWQFLSSPPPRRDIMLRLTWPRTACRLLLHHFIENRPQAASQSSVVSIYSKLQQYTTYLLTMQYLI